MRLNFATVSERHQQQFGYQFIGISERQKPLAVKLYNVYGYKLLLECKISRMQNIFHVLTYKIYCVSLVCPSFWTTRSSIHKDFRGIHTHVAHPSYRKLARRRENALRV